MQLNERQRLILMGVLHDQRRLAALPWGDSHSMSRDELGRYRLRIRYAREGLVSMNLPEWIGHAPSNSEHVLFHREYARLEVMGLLVRCNPFGGHRTTHLKLTPEGLQVAERLLAEEYGQDGGDIDETIDWSNIELMAIEMPADTNKEGGSTH